MSENAFSDVLRYYFDVYDYLKNHLSSNNPNAPLHLYIEPTNFCNLACPFCDNMNMKRERKRLDIRIYQRVIAQLEETGWIRNLRISLSGQGESLIHRRLPEMISLAKNAGAGQVELITNSTMLTAQASNQLIASGLDRIQFSIDSIRKESYDVLRKSKNPLRSYYHDAIRNILCFLKINLENDQKVFTSISALMTSVNRNEREEFVAFWEQLPVDNIYFPPLSTLQNNTPLEEVERFAGDIGKKPKCVIPWTVMSIKSNGDVTICAHDFHNVYPVGNVGKDHIGDLWNNERARKLRRAVMEAEFDDFMAIGHDCVHCNNPCNGANVDNFLAGLPRLLEKTILGKYTKKSYDEKKSLMLEELLAKFCPDKMRMKSRTPGG